MFNVLQNPVSTYFSIRLLSAQLGPPNDRTELVQAVERRQSLNTSKNQTNYKLQIGKCERGTDDI